MSILSRLASAQDRNDELPNQKLAARLVKSGSRAEIRELVENLGHRNATIQSDCIKVLYEIGEQKPKLIAPYVDNFLDLLNRKNNRLVWGAMTALDAVTLENPKKVAQALPKILKAADGELVIARDHSVGILIKLASLKAHQKKTWPLLLEQLKRAPTNQLPMYAEQSLPIIDAAHAPAVIKTLSFRLRAIPKLSKRQRVEKVIKKITMLS